MGTEGVEMSRLKNGEAENNVHKQSNEVHGEGFIGRNENLISDECDGDVGKASDGVEVNVHPDAVSVGWICSCTALVSKYKIIFPDLIS